MAGTLLVAIIGGIALLRGTSEERHRRNFHCVDPGMLYRSGQMSPEGFAQTLEEYGIRTVISLRNPKGEHEINDDDFEAEACQSRGLRFLRIRTFQLVAHDPEGRARAAVEEFLTIMNDPNVRKPVLVHCYAGVHRTGTYCAAFRIRHQHWSVDDAIAELIRIGGSRSTIDPELLDFVRSLAHEATGKINSSRWQHAFECDASSVNDNSMQGR